MILKSPEIVQLSGAEQLGCGSGIEVEKFEHVNYDDCIRFKE